MITSCNIRRTQTFYIIIMVMTFNLMKKEKICQLATPQIIVLSLIYFISL